MNISLSFVTLPLTDPSNTIEKLLQELRLKPQEMLNFVGNYDSQSAIEANRVTEEVQAEILRRFKELEQRAQKAEIALLQHQQVARLTSEVRKLGQALGA